LNKKRPFRAVGPAAGKKFGPDNAPQALSQRIAEFETASAELRGSALQAINVYIIVKLNQ